MDTLWQDVKFGARMLAKHPGFTAVAILTLALGVGATTAIFSVVNGVLLQPLPYERPGELVMLREISKEGNQMNVPEQNFLDWHVAAQSYERAKLPAEALRWYQSLFDAGADDQPLALSRIASIKRALGKSSRTIGAEPSLDALSTTMTSHAKSRAVA